MNITEIKVVTFDGTTASRKDCRRISGQYYIKNVQCFLIDNQWHRINNGLIEYDNEINQWIRKGSSNLIGGVIRINPDNSFVFGKYSPNLSKNTKIYNPGNGNQYNIISEDIIDKSQYTEDLQTGWFFPKINIRTPRKGIGVGYSFKIYYIFEHLFELFKENYDKYFKYKPNVNFSSELDKTTFGIEYETYNGQIAERHCLKTGLIPLRDGSLRHDTVEPFEYTTIPLQGEKGLYSIKEHCELLDKYCVKDLSCSLHIHIGNYGRSPEYIVSLYRTILNIQNDLYDMFPKYTRKTSLFKSTGKDYCNPLDDLKFNENVEESLQKMFDYYTGNYYDESTIPSPGLRRTPPIPKEKPVVKKSTPKVESEEQVPIREEEITWNIRTFGSVKPKLDSDFSEPTVKNKWEPDKLLKKDSPIKQEDSFSLPYPAGMEERLRQRERPIYFEDKKRYYEIGMEHPNDPTNGDHKWQVNYRYKLINLIPLMFGSRGTVEFRMHTVTFNKDKVINWLFIANAICKFAYDYRDIISTKGTNVTLRQLIHSSYSSNLSDYLNSYIEYRKKLMYNHSSQGDFIGTLDLKEDHLNYWDYSFKSLI